MPRTAQDKRDARSFAQETIPEMCFGCARNGFNSCRAITVPAHFYEHYGECFAKMDAKQARLIESALKFYTPEPLRWLQLLNRLRREGLI
jgi:hypothetical protein